jgi:Transposase
LDSLKGLIELMPMNENPTVRSGRRRQAFTEQKFAILQQRRAGMPAVELCRTHDLKANAINRWKKWADHGLGDHGEFIPQIPLLPLQRKVEELERALGRKAH